ncbi:ABC transporter ATP-binding protein [Vulgatibacter incomptus]|uniref:ABC transporter ATP-binding protein n=1 Tax=Vulgatibacter incomptus TaxID=1391653 RepID=A0A0K1PH30_9BACT|nr:ABC transporter ATP-binding protein [Vulgatibacter incomptus]AKU92429.1 ABC transporter ATP-binding protein [Vulgatibacter incomptus]
MNVPPPVVELDGLTKRYGDLTALDAVTLDIRAGEIFALLGPNGAGKTTLIGCVSGLVIPTAGTARVLGRDTQREYRETRRVVGLVPQEINFDPFFTVEETLRFQAGYFGVKLSEARLAEILDALDLGRKRKAGTRELSGGMKRRLLIGKALVHDPKVLFLDEPTAGVDVELRRDLWKYVRRLRDQGTTVVLTTHYLEEAEALADRIGMIDRGKLLLVEEKAALMRRLGRRTLRLQLAEPLTRLPGALEAKGARLVETGMVIELEQPLSEELGPVVAAALEAGLSVRDVETRRTGLEEIYVGLLSKDGVRP